jgi:hypothetical protein
MASTYEFKIAPPNERSRVVSHEPQQALAFL